MTTINLSVPEYTKASQIEHITIRPDLFEGPHFINEEWLASLGDILARIPCVDGLVVILRTYEDEPNECD